MIHNPHLYDNFASKNVLTIVMVWNIKTYFSKIETLKGEKFCAHPRQNVFQILNSLKILCLDLDT